ncbi:hypothetical protein I4U23_013533 [Adineta vaga]|nr:hypothetical protein I4U23_013533 [Adineta vaga]
MNSRSVFLVPFRFPIFLLIISSLLLLQSSRPVQSISLSRLCGQFGHSCFGANWGKRSNADATSTQFITFDLNDDDATRMPTVIQDDILEKLRMKLHRQRWRQLLGLEEDRIRRS